MGEKRHPYGSLLVFAVGVHENDRLPGSQCQDSVQDGNDGAGRHERRNDVIGAMTPAAVTVKPSRIPREQLVDLSEQIPVGTGSRLEECYTCRAVGNEYGHEPITLAPHEGFHPVSDVERPGGSTRPDAEGLGIHLR